MKLYPFDINGQEMMLTGDDIHEMDCLLVTVHGNTLNYQLLSKEQFISEYLFDNELFPYNKVRFGYIPQDIRNIWWLRKNISNAVESVLK